MIVLGGTGVCFERNGSMQLLPYQGYVEIWNPTYICRRRNSHEKLKGEVNRRFLRYLKVR